MHLITKRLTKTIGFLMILLAITIAKGAEAANTTGYAWSENIGWIDASHTTVTDTELEGYLYSGNIGWISLNCSNDNSCGNAEYKVTNNQGILDGFAWSENIGWIDMSDVIINKDTGIFSGYAYSGNIGFISFNCSNDESCGNAQYQVSTDWTVQTPRRRTTGSSVQARITNLEQSGNQEEADRIREQFNVEPTSEPRVTTPTSLSQLIETLISLGIITGDNIERARTAAQSLPTTTPTTPGTFQFTRDLQLNDRGTDVIALQQFLNHRDYIVNPNQGEEGSKGHETSFFGELTRQALIKFQIANNITPAEGYFGPITRSIANPMIR